MSAIRVSVLLPIYNAERTLAAALSSLRKQSLHDFECLAIDDGSNDGSFAVVEAFARSDPRIKPIRLPHRGLVATLNAGLAWCRGAFIARMDADDAMHPQRLERQSAALEARPDWAGVGCHVRLFPDRLLKPKRRAYAAWLNGIRHEDEVFSARFIECPLAHPTLCLRREWATRYAYRDLGWPEDYDLVLRLLCDGQRLGVVPEQLLYWRDSPARLSRVAPAYEQTNFVRCKAEFLASSWLNQGSTYTLWGYGDTGRALRRALLERGKHPTHIVELHPGRIGQRIHGAVVIRPEQLTDLQSSRLETQGSSATSGARLPPPEQPRIVVSVAGASARGQIREKLAQLGFEPEQHYVFAA